MKHTLWWGKWRPEGQDSKGSTAALHPLPELTGNDTSSLYREGAGTTFSFRDSERGGSHGESNFWLAGRNRTALQTEPQPNYTSYPLRRPEIQNTVAEPGRGGRQHFSCLPRPEQPDDLLARCSFQDPKEGNLFKGKRKGTL